MDYVVISRERTVNLQAKQYIYIAPQNMNSGKPDLR